MNKYFLFLLILLTDPAEAAPDPLEPALRLFQKGAYTQSIEAARKLNPSTPREKAAVALFLATAYGKNQAFDRALPEFQRALTLKSDAPNLHYDYGQALFATQRLKEAEAQFRLSISQRFKAAASAYYVGYILQLLEDGEGAKSFYRRIQRLKSDPEKVKQPALYQIAEIEFETYRQEKDRNRRLRLMEVKVLPVYRLARDFAEDTPTAEQAKTKIAEIEREIDEVRLRMVNGLPIPKKPYALRLSQEIGYDSNVITEADNALIQVSDKNSLVAKSSLYARYQFNWRRRFSFVPEMNASLTMHSRRSTPRVYQNDNINFAPALRTKWEHWSRGKPATGLLDLEYNYMLRDYDQQHHFPYYLRSWNLVLGERVSWFKTGSTTLKLSLKLAENYNPDRNAISPAMSFQQNVKIYEKYDLQNTFTADYLHARNDVNDERNYKLRHSVTLQDVFAKFDATPSLTLSLKDTMKQKGQRGNEFLFNPSVVFNRDMFAKIDTTFEYAFSKNYSKSKDQYQYTKHELKVGASYGF